MKIAVVGVGTVGCMHTRLINEIGQQLVAVCDINSDKIKNFDCKKYCDYKEMIDNEDIDIVHICTPHYLHADMVIYALSKGIHVLCEKPLCIKVEDMDRILKAQNNSTAQLGVCHQNRYNPETIFAKKYLQEHKAQYGFASMVWKRNKDYYAQEQWRGKWASEGGGVLINQALHTLDLLIYLMGEPDYLTASCSNLTLQDCIEVEDTATILCSGKANFSLFATNGGNTDLPIFLIIKTQDSLLEISSKEVRVDRIRMDASNFEASYGKSCYGVGHKALFMDFYSCVENNKKFAIDANEALKVIKVILSAYKSNGKKIKI